MMVKNLNFSKSSVNKYLIYTVKKKPNQIRNI